jgi:hypothetical protein
MVLSCPVALQHKHTFLIVDSKILPFIPAKTEIYDILIILIIIDNNDDWRIHVCWQTSGKVALSQMPTVYNRIKVQQLHS